jgi:hypothetical protein
MKRLVILMFSLLCILYGCEAIKPEQQTTDPGEADFSCSDDARSYPQDRKLSEADFAIMMQEYSLEFMGANYTAAFGVNWVDITPDDVYEKIGCQIFKDGVNCQAFLAYQGEIYELPGFFGGYGIMSLDACDFNNSGSYDLIFTTSWGSGLHRSEIWIFDFSLLEPQMIGNMVAGKDIVLSKVNDQKFDVVLAKLDHSREALGGYADLSIFIPDIRIGTVEAKDGNPIFTYTFK